MAMGATAAASRRGRSTTATAQDGRAIACTGRPLAPRSAGTSGCRPRLARAGGRLVAGACLGVSVASAPRATATAGTGTRAHEGPTVSAALRIGEAIGAPCASSNGGSLRTCVAPAKGGARTTAATSGGGATPCAPASFTRTATASTGAAPVAFSGRT